MKNINDIVNFLDEVITYLHDWLSSFDNKYHPYSIQDVQVLFMNQLAHNGSDIAKTIKDIKDGYINGTIILHEYDILKTQKVVSLYPKLLKKHLENIKEFEHKYNIK